MKHDMKSEHRGSLCWFPPFITSVYYTYIIVVQFYKDTAIPHQQQWVGSLYTP